MEDEEAEQGRGGFAQGYWAPTHHGESGCGGPGQDPWQLGIWIHGKDTGEDASGSEVSGGGLAVVADITAHFESAGEALGMIAGHAGAGWEIGWTAEDEIEEVGRRQDVGIAEITASDVIAVGETVPLGGFEGESDAVGLGFDGGELGTGKAPCGDHADGSDAGTEVEDATCGGAPGSAVPGGEDVVGGEAVTVGQLEQSEVATDGVEGLVWAGKGALTEGTWGNGAWFGPAFEGGIRGLNRRAHVTGWGRGPGGTGDGSGGSGVRLLRCCVAAEVHDHEGEGGEDNDAEDDTDGDEDLVDVVRLLAEAGFLGDDHGIAFTEADGLAGLLGLFLAGLVAEFDLTEAEDLTGFEGQLLVDSQLDLIEVGAVGGVEVPDHDIIALEPHFAVMGADGGFRNGEPVVIEPADRGLGGRQFNIATGETFSEYDQLSHSVRWGE